MPVNSPHAMYSRMIPRWEKCRDVYEGSERVKERGIKYLPATGDHENKSKKYEAYKQRALFFNAMRRTVEGLAGAIHQKELEIKAPSEVEKHLEDITLTNVSIEGFSLKVTQEILVTGRYGILVDLSGKEVSTQRPFWKGFCAEDIISWRTTRVDGDEVLTMVVLREDVESVNPEDPFETDVNTRYRVLHLEIDENGSRVYTQQVWSEDQNGEFFIKEEIAMIRRGAPLDFIPFVFISPCGIEVDVTRPPLEDVADINLSHYMTMADLEHGRHFTALPTPVVSGVKGDTKLALGSTYAWNLEMGGKAFMLEFTGAGLKALETAEEKKRNHMATLGARLLEDQPNQPETAKAVMLRHSGETASLRTVAISVDQGITQALKWHVWWDGGATTVADVDSVVSLNKDFFDVKASPEEIKTLLTLWQSDAISFETFYFRLQHGEWTRPGVSFEEEKKAMETENPEEEEPVMPPNPFEEDDEEPVEEDAESTE